MKKQTNQRFLIGSWVSFYPFDVDGYEYQLDQMQAAGLNFNIFPMTFGGRINSAETCAMVEEQYAARNMLYFMNGGLNREILAGGVACAKELAHCIGYHLKDEPVGAELPLVGEIARAYREADGERYPFVNLFPSYAQEDRLGGTYEEYCTRFLAEVGAENIEYLSHDYYPFAMDRTNQGIFADMDVLRRLALKNGRLRTHAFPQSSAWNGIRMPNIDEMRWNVYAYLAYGFKALSWFNLVCPGRSDTEGEGFRDSIIYRDGTIRNKQLFKDFGNLNHEVLNLGDTLMELDAIHAYHTLDGLDGVERLPADWMIRPTEEADLVISHMVTRAGDETYVMLFNKDWAHPANVSFSISRFSGIESLDYISPFTGHTYPVAIHDGVFTETFRPGEGKLYKVNGRLSCRVWDGEEDSSRWEVDLAVAKKLIGVDLDLMDPAMQNQPITVQISTNKRFTEEKTKTYRWDTLPADGRLRFDPTVGKYLRLSFDDLQGASCGSCIQLRARFAEEMMALEAQASEESPRILLDFADLDHALSVVEGLVGSEYSKASWNAVLEQYRVALSVKEGVHTQETVDDAYWQLLDRVRELEPVQWTLPAQPSRDEERDEHGVRVTGGVLTAAAMTLAGAVAGAFVGILATRRNHKKKKK